MDKQDFHCPPLDRLFQLGEVEWGVEWQGADPDYVGELGLTSEHVPALIDIARLQMDLDDFPDDDSGWAPVHAWRALAQLRAAEAVEPLLAMLTVLTETGDDYHQYDFPVVFGMIGPPAIPALAAYLHNAEGGEGKGRERGRRERGTGALIDAAKQRSITKARVSLFLPIKMQRYQPK
jgi:hypothetical protein